MDVYSDIFQLGYGFIQTEGEPSGEHKANPIIVGSVITTRTGSSKGTGFAAESCSRTRSRTLLPSSAMRTGR